MINQRTKPTNLKVHQFPIESFIGGFYISEKVCDDLVDFFESNPQRQKAGRVNKRSRADVSNNPTAEIIKYQEGDRLSLVEQESKKSIDMSLYPWHEDKNNETLDNYFKCLNDCIKEYEFLYPQANELNSYGPVEGLNIQKYNPGDGFYGWHHERGGIETSSRAFAHMTYLNDVEEGGTEFWFQKLISPAKKGLTLIWPSDWTHQHRGQVSKTETKYIITGWLNYRE